MRELKLSNGISRYDTSTFPLGDLEISIANLPRTSGDFRFAGYMNGKKIAEETLDRDAPKVVISKDKLTAGAFSARVLHYQGGVMVQRYNVENLVITALDEDLTATPEIELLTQKSAELETQIAELETAVETLTKSLTEANTALAESREKIAALEKGLTALTGWAYKCETNIPYLDGGTMEEFLQRLKGETS